MEEFKAKKLHHISKILLSKFLVIIKIINRFLRIHLGVEFEELIGEFIKDESGTWWLVNIKGYLLKPESI